MSNLRRLIVGLLALSSCPALSAQSLDLPAAPIQARLKTACTECHSSAIIQQQRLSQPAWTKEVNKMIKWGAVVDPADVDAFIDYLSNNFSAAKPPDPMPRSATKSP
jgi:hypothetical protein